MFWRIVVSGFETWPRGGCFAVTAPPGQFPPTINRGRGTLHGRCRPSSLELLQLDLSSPRFARRRLSLDAAFALGLRYVVDPLAKSRVLSFFAYFVSLLRTFFLSHFILFY